MEQQISTGFYWHGVYRSATMLRGIIVSAVFRKTTEMSTTSLDDLAAVTLMSTDVERIIAGFSVLHELWAAPIQIVSSFDRSKYQQKRMLTFPRQYQLGY